MMVQNGVNNFTFIDKKFNSIYGKENKDFLIKWLVNKELFLKESFYVSMRVKK